jgi:hypothetical protein
LQQVEGGQDRLDDALEACDNPFDGLRGLLRIFMESGIELTGGTASIEATAPIEVSLTPPMNLVDGTLKVRVSADQHLPRQQLRVAVTPTGSEAATGRKTVDQLRWSRDAAGWLGTGMIKVGHGVTEVEVLLQASEKGCDKRVVRDVGALNPAVTTYAAFDANAKRFIGLIDGTLAAASKYAKEFERAVPRLFHFLGFRVDVLAGDLRLKHGPDALAFADSEFALIVIECTTEGLGDLGKLKKLYQRDFRVRRHTRGYDVVPLIATSSERSALSEEEKRRAAADGILVLTRENLVELWSMAVRGVNSSDALSYIRSRGNPLHDVRSGNPVHALFSDPSVGV